MKPNLKKILVVDVEATCWGTKEEKEDEKNKNEIIEIGTCLYNISEDTIESANSFLVKPEYSVVSPFCNTLTGHTQLRLDKEGLSFSVICSHLQQTFDSRRLVWVSWGDYDRKQFEIDCKRKGAQYPFSSVHINLKVLFGLLYRQTNTFGVRKALNFLNLSFIGTPHSGVDDAFNIARMLQVIFASFDLSNNKKFCNCKRN